MPKRFFIFGILALLSGIIFDSCKNENPLLTGQAELEIREDTIFFDTVFTKNRPLEPRSVSKQFTITNPYSSPVKTQIVLASGTRGEFKLNVDGVQITDPTEFEIPANDSLFVFLELYANPNNDPQSLPLIIRDSIQFFTNGQEQKVMLIAWGQDAHYYKNHELTANETWADQDKVYVVYGYVFVPENMEFTIAQGVKLHMAPQSWIFVEGKLNIQGTVSNPVYFEGDRLQPDYENRAGQWGGIWIENPSTGNEIAHARIKNGTVGIYVDSMDNFQDVNILVRNTEVKNMSFDGIAARHANIYVENSTAFNCGRFTYFSQYGGISRLVHCSFGSYANGFARSDPTFVFNNVRTDQLGNVLETYKYDFRMVNSAVDGYKEEEVALSLIPSESDTVSLVSNLLKTEQEPLLTVNHKITKANFVDTDIGDFHLMPGSQAIDNGVNVGLNTDFEENVRDASPDIGAFEF